MNTSYGWIKFTIDVVTDEVLTAVYDDVFGYLDENQKDAYDDITGRANGDESMTFTLTFSYPNNMGVELATEILEVDKHLLSKGYNSTFSFESDAIKALHDADVQTVEGLELKPILRYTFRLRHQHNGNPLDDDGLWQLGSYLNIVNESGNFSTKRYTDSDNYTGVDMVYEDSDPTNVIKFRDDLFELLYYDNDFEPFWVGTIGIVPTGLEVVFTTMVTLSKNSTEDITEEEKHEVYHDIINFEGIDGSLIRTHFLQCGGCNQPHVLCDIVSKDIETAVGTGVGIIEVLFDKGWNESDHMIDIVERPLD